LTWGRRPKEFAGGPWEPRSKKKGPGGPRALGVPRGGRAGGPYPGGAPVPREPEPRGSDLLGPGRSTKHRRATPMVSGSADLLGPSLRAAGKLGLLDPLCGGNPAGNNKIKTQNTVGKGPRPSVGCASSFFGLGFPGLGHLLGQSEGEGTRGAVVQKGEVVRRTGVVPDAPRRGCFSGPVDASFAIVGSSFVRSAPGLWFKVGSGERAGVELGARGEMGGQAQAEVC